LKKEEIGLSGAVAPPCGAGSRRAAVHVSAGEDEASSSPPHFSSFRRFVLREKGELLSLS